MAPHASHILRGYLTLGVLGGIVALFGRFPANQSELIFEHAIIPGHAESSFECPPMLSASHPAPELAEHTQLMPVYWYFLWVRGVVTGRCSFHGPQRCDDE